MRVRPLILLSSTVAAAELTRFVPLNAEQLLEPKADLAAVTDT